MRLRQVWYSSAALPRHFHVTADNPALAAHLDGPSAVHDAAISRIGVMLEPAKRGGPQVAGTVADVRGIEIAGRFPETDGRQFTRAPFARVVERLRGSHGDRRTLVLRCAGAHMSVHAAVQTGLSVAAH